MGRHEAEAMGRQTDLVLDALLPKHKKDESTCQNSDFVNINREVQDVHIGNDHSQTLTEDEEGFISMFNIILKKFLTILKKKISTSSVTIVVIPQNTKCFTTFSQKFMNT